MKKWQEIFFNGLINLSVAMIAGGILKLVLDSGAVVSAVLISFFGVYLFIVATISAKNADEKRG